MAYKFIVVILLVSFNLSMGFIDAKSSRQITHSYVGQQTQSVPLLSTYIKSTGNVYHYPSVISKQSRLHLDIFGLGPPEVLIILGSIFLFYGPERVRGQLRDRGVQNEVIQSKGPLKDREDRIEDLTNFADRRRKQRAWQRVNERIENEDPEIMDKLDEVGL
jgi:hypothetical protein